MPDLIHVALFPADSHGCGFYRMRLPAAHVPATTQEYDRAKLSTSPNVRTGEMLLHRVDVGDADVAVFQRPLDHRLVPVIEQLKRQGVATVVEIDDDLTALDPHHASYPGMHPRLSPWSNWNHLRAACRAADLVTVSTPALARRFAGHGRVVVLPNCVERRLLSIALGKVVDVGWGGIVGTHPRDPQVVGDAIARLQRDGLLFGVVGDGVGVPEAFRLREDAAATGWLELDAYYQAVSTFRCGIVPLANSAFNHAKSALKGIEYAALGVPFVASPLPEYQTLAAQGAGRLATKPKRWLAEIRAALADDEAADRGRAVVEERYLIEDQAWRWAEAWHRAVEIRLRAGRKAVAA